MINENDTPTPINKLEPSVYSWLYLYIGIALIDKNLRNIYIQKRRTKDVNIFSLNLENIVCFFSINIHAFSKNKKVYRTTIMRADKVAIISNLFWLISVPCKGLEELILFDCSGNHSLIIFIKSVFSQDYYKCRNTPVANYFLYEN